MIDHRVGSREEWLAERTKLLGAEKELTRRNDELARKRQELPWVRVDKDYGSDFNYDFSVSFTDEQLLQGPTYNFRVMPPVPADELDQWPRDLPGTSAFALDGGDVHHTYSSYARRRPVPSPPRRDMRCPVTPGPGHQGYTLSSRVRYSSVQCHS